MTTTILRVTNFILLLIFISTVGQSQEAITTNYKYSHRKQARLESKQYINQLKNGALLVRLSSKQNSITALRKIGKEKLANKVENKQVKLNKKIIEAFRLKYNFSPVYFIYSNLSVKVLEKQFDNLVYLNDSLQTDSSISLKGKSFLTAEFTTIEQREDQFNGGYYYALDRKGLQRQVKYYGGPAMGFGACVIKSDAFVQLRKPFPYYVRTFDSLFFKRKPKNVVRKMNRKLHRFYKRMGA